MIGGLTYVAIFDRQTEQAFPVSDLLISFADYNEAMSYAQWIDVKVIGTSQGEVWVWNWNGGSGRWLNNAFTPFSNNNYPTP